MDESLLDKKASFQALDLDDRLLRALGGMGLVHPTLVQAKAIPLALAGKDVLARAKTGSGKTAAFWLPVLHKILAAKDALPAASEQRKATRALVLVPTRELAEQVTNYAAGLTRFCDRDVAVVNIAGSAPLHVQAPLLAEQPDVVVSTPAKIMKHLVARSIDLSQSLEMLVIDEADLVLSFGYEDDIKGIVARLPKIHQSMLLSATLNKGVESLKSLVLSAPAVLKLEDNREEAAKLVQYVIRCTEDEKYLLTYVILKLRLIAGKCILFVNDIDRCYRLKLFLEQFSIKACVLNSELPLNSRYHIVEEFNRGVYDYIIATDESDRMGERDNAGGDEMEVEEAVVEESTTENPPAEKTDPHAEKTAPAKKPQRKRKRAQDKEYGVSRGIDFKGVAAVINFDFPASARAYTHRVGRTARAGQRGMSLSFVERDSVQERVASSQAQQDEAVFERVAQQQQKRGCEIQPYRFDMKQVEGFRYRSTDALRNVSRNAIREARIKELKHEILNSEKLKAYFEDKPQDLHFLRHDKALHPSQIQPHMKHVPQYLLPKISGIAQADGVATTAEDAFVPFNKPKRPPRRGKPARKPRGKGADPLKALGKRRRNTIDFGDPEAVRALNSALLRVYFDLDVQLPPDSLCPAVANRLGYVEWIRDSVLAELGPGSRLLPGLDVGTGASCIYPLLGARVLPRCSFVGTDVNAESIAAARANVGRNGLQDRIALFLSRDRAATLPLDAEGFPLPPSTAADGSAFAFSMCNPPFYRDRAEREQLARAKSRPPGLSTDGKDDELYTAGGEDAFLARMVDESARLGARIHWYTTMTGRKATLAALKTRVRAARARRVREGSLVHGRTTRWVLAWSFLDQTRFALELPGRTPADAARWLEAAAAALAIAVHPAGSEDGRALYACAAAERTWTRQWRRQQQQQQQRQRQKPGEADAGPAATGSTPPVLRFTAAVSPNGASAAAARIDLFLEPGYDSSALLSLHGHLSRALLADSASSAPTKPQPEPAG
ncbi:ATP-dependent DNA/RNA helicase [Coemansia javaensis]|uniref:RNA helicase n=1 Tax=Coemansia javaensis TaxID=2761396 RepID=A0A9W8LG10_9FUNG|nr:ATP-dependent DNA/RNA helicase [Coemansia javaensis]